MQTIKENNISVVVSEKKEFSSLLATIQEIVLEESFALEHLAKQIPQATASLVQAMINCSGKIIFSGVGKSGIIGKKIAATCSSLGTPSLSIHPTDALHGDMGLIQKNDLFIGISKSGKTVELCKLFDILAAQGIITALITCSKKITLSSVSIIINLPLDQEVSYFKLAPTSSSLITMAFGDAIALVASKLQGFNHEKYAQVHPAGELGKTLSSGLVRSFTKTKSSLPIVEKNSSFFKIIETINNKSLGLTLVQDEQEKIIGIITDGDIRRACLKYYNNLNQQTAFNIMTHQPQSIDADEPAHYALKKMEDFQISSLLVLNQQDILGIIHIHDLVQAGLRT